MMALKKAYADVILNTAKEAAARVMASERRALQYQSELAAVKDEALHMLLRLKNMIDAKTAESETTSLKQQSKIEELEAQLNEAEDVITDLREELKHVRRELEKTKNIQINSLDGQSVKQVASFQESAKPGALALFSKKEFECVTSCDVKNKSLTVNSLDEKCCNSKKQTEHLCRSNLDDSDFTSFLMRSKEAELCKNGVTQRTHALEGNLLDEKLLTRDVHNQDYSKKDGLAKDIEGKVAKFNAPSAKTEKMEIKKHIKLHKRPKRKILSYCRYCLLSSCKIHTNENCRSSKGVCSLSTIKSCAISKWKRRKRRHGHVGMVSSVFKSSKPSFVLSGVTESIEAVKKFEIVKDHELLSLEGCAVQNSAGPSSNMTVEVVDTPSTKTDLEDAKAFEENYGSPGQAYDNRLLKYTFQRKRRRESLVNLYKKFDSEKSATKMKVEDKLNDALDAQKCA
ncbi:uncharacterized protein LOC130739304 [Lotus japonicus]|uniref:uncharacterized protein LOC130739304 n=1 Tax=Lotus japonicus TaxID=34305 RepID=UPI00258B44A8|nr:uncharacterized protein LOC130739304 [Lotus japonicus]XP_057447546.1 uncharacterized protein LOC130739304 [Lotus japonicus]